MTVGCAIQIVEHYGENNFKVKKEALKEIYGDEKVSNLPLVALCIAGAARKGKSFMLNFFLDYLIHKEKFPTKEWILKESTRLNGFEFRDGEDRMTLGIWAWNHVFVIENSDGKKVGVTLIDSQGSFDRNTSYEDCSAIFAMTSMFSSVMCFNVFNDLQEDKLNDFTAFIEHGKMIVQNLGGSEKLFQSLVFIIRDFQHIKKWDDENGGQRYVEKLLGDVQHKDLQKIRDNLKESYEKMFGFVFPYPGDTVAQEKTSKISEMNPKFVQKAKTMVETLLSQKNLQTKRLGSAQFFAKNMIDYIPLCVKCFNDHPHFSPRAVHTLNRQYLIDLEANRAMENYEKVMNEVFVNRRNGYEKQEMIKEISDKNYIAIKKEIEERIKNQNVSFEVVEKFKETIKNALLKYQDKNRLLVENEKKRLDMIKQKQQHEYQLAQRASAEAERLASQKRQYELQQEKERQEYKRKEAEEASAREKERREHEKEQARIREEMEKQRKESEKRQAEEAARIKKDYEKKLEDEKRKREEETAKIQRDFARMELERSSRSQTPSVIYVGQPSHFPMGNLGGSGLGNYGGFSGYGMGNSGGGFCGGRSSYGSEMGSSSGSRGNTRTIGKNGREYFHGSNGKFISRDQYYGNL